MFGRPEFIATYWLICVVLDLTVWIHKSGYD